MARPVVLVVDDSEIACESVKHTLERAAFDVVALTSPFGFIKTIRESQPVLILVDVGLGILNGSWAGVPATTDSSMLMHSSPRRLTLPVNAARRSWPRIFVTTIVSSSPTATLSTANDISRHPAMKPRPGGPPSRAFVTPT
jgi:CheY-like chemotaxis protein